MRKNVLGKYIRIKLERGDLLGSYFLFMTNESYIVSENCSKQLKEV